MMTANEAFAEILKTASLGGMRDIHEELIKNNNYKDFIVSSVKDFLNMSLLAGPERSLEVSCTYLSTFYITGILHGIRMAAASPDPQPPIGDKMEQELRDIWTKEMEGE